jgi:hypothetical protein
MDVHDDVAGPERLERLVPLVHAVRASSGGELRGGARASAAEANRFPSGEILVVPTGEIADDLTLSRADIESLLRAALAVSDDTPSVVWDRGDSELAVHTARTRVAIGPRHGPAQPANPDPLRNVATVVTTENRTALRVVQIRNPAT